MSRLTLFICALCALCLGLAGPAWAQLGHVAGSVRDERGTALPGAVVRLAGTSQGTATDAAGHFELSDVPVGP